MGCRRFLDRVWRLQAALVNDDGVRKELLPDVHGCIKKVSEDYERMKFNTAIAAMMALVNQIAATGKIMRGEMKILVQLLNPVAPHITEEIWQNLGEKDSLTRHPWPKWDEKALVRDEIEIAIQINGKVRGRMMVSTSLTPEEAQKTLPETPEVKAAIGDKTIRKIIYVKGRLLNIVVG